MALLPFRKSVEISAISDQCFPAYWLEAAARPSDFLPESIYRHRADFTDRPTSGHILES
jgi:hypothetical protein